MVHAKAFFDAFTRKGVRFFTGVPDSLLKDFCAHVTTRCNPRTHVIAANEGNAIAIAAGHHLATGKIALVYLQNAGLGNIVNPLLSLADPKVYGIPMVLVIGWRGEPGTKDEPQHRSQGPLTIPLLRTLGVPYKVLPTSERDAVRAVARACDRAKKENRAVALVVREGTFAPHPFLAPTNTYSLTREEALHACVETLPSTAVVVSTTGKLSRELFEFRKATGARHEKDFLTVGSMGHASQVALGIALSQPRRPVYCFDGDGAALMHLGSLAIIAQAAPKNFKHIIFNNGTHESVGGQPTAAFVTDLSAVARACGYAYVASVSDATALSKELRRFKKARGAAFLEIRVKSSSRKDLTRPTRTPLENKRALMRYLKR